LPEFTKFVFQFCILKFRLYIFILVCHVLGSCSHSSHNLQQVERLIESAPDSALCLLRQMQPNKLTLPSDRALYGILLFQALDKNFQTLKPDSVINFSIRYYKLNRKSSRLAIAYFYKARMYKYATRYEDAATLYLKVLENSKKKVNNLLVGKTYSDMGEICSLQHQYHNAQLKYQLAADYFTKADEKRYALHALLDVGRMYQYMNMHTHADSCYRKALGTATDSLDRGACLQEIALNHYSSQRYDSALNYLQRLIPFPYLGNNRAIRYYKLGAVLLDLKQYDSAYYYTSSALKYYSDIYTRRECYRILADIASMKGHKQQTNIYIRNYLACMDSIQKIGSQTQVPVLESFHRVKTEGSKTKRYLLVTSLIVPLLGFGALAFIRRLRNGHKREHASLMEKYRITQNKVYQRDINALHRKIEERKAIQTRDRSIISSSEREQLTLQLYDELLHLNDWDTFSRDMNLFFGNLLTHLETRYPTITRKEIIWCFLTLLQISPADILTLIGYKPSSQSKFKQRLAKKMNLNDASRLVPFLEQMIGER